MSSNPAIFARGQADTRIPGLSQLPAGTNRATLSAPVYDPATNTTYQAPLVAGDGAVTTNATIGGPKLVQYRSSLLFGVPAEALTLDRLTPATIVPGTLATVDNPSDTPFATTLPAKQYVATRTDPATPGAVQVPAYIGAAVGDTVAIVWVAVATGGGGGGPTYTAGPGIDITGSTISAKPVVSASTELHFDQPARFYAPLASGTFTTSLAGLLACAFTRIVLGPSCTVPTLSSAFRVSGAFVAGAPNEYLFLVEPDGATVQVVITQLP